MGADEQESSSSQGATPVGARDVFVSYASADVGVADQLVEHLERAGVTCWIAPRDVPPGAHYAEEIIRGINDSKALVLVLSSSSVQSAHVGKEIERASSKRRPIIAIRMDATPLPPALEYFLSESQWVEVGAGGIESAAAKVVAAIRRQPAPMRGTTASSSPPMVPSASGGSKRWLAVAGIAVLAIIGIFATRVWNAKPIAPPVANAPATAASSPAPSAISEKSIAVLPFVDMSEKKDQEYFADGMAEEVLDLLTKIPGLTVIGRTSSFQFKGKNQDLRAIGAALNASYVLEGSVRRAGDEVRITTQLINSKTGAHEWSESYDRPFGDVLKLQDAIASAVVREMQLSVVAGYLPARSTLADAEAYQLMLRARHTLDRYDRDGLEEALSLYRQALDRDPASADAQAGLANAYYNQGGYGIVPMREAFPKARTAAEAALKLNPKSGVSYEVLGFIALLYDWDWAAAERHFQQEALASPGNVGGYLGDAWRLLVLGRWDDALEKVNAARLRDPLDPRIYECMTWIQLGRGRPADAETAIRRGLEIRPTYAWGRFMLGMSLLAQRKPEKALAEIDLGSAEGNQWAIVAMAQDALGHKSDADSALQRLTAQAGGDSAIEVASIYAARGQKALALTWLERAFEQKGINAFLVKSFFPLKGIEGEPRYAAVLKKMNLPL